MYDKTIYAKPNQNWYNIEYSLQKYCSRSFHYNSWSFPPCLTKQKYFLYLIDDAKKIKWKRVREKLSKNSWMMKCRMQVSFAYLRNDLRSRVCLNNLSFVMRKYKLYLIIIWYRVLRYVLSSLFSLNILKFIFEISKIYVFWSWHPSH